jgi:hypothetical protein
MCVHFSELLCSLHVSGENLFLARSEDGEWIQKNTTIYKIEIEIEIENLDILRAFLRLVDDP